MESVIAHTHVSKPPQNPNGTWFGELPGWRAHPHREGDPDPTETESPVLGTLPDSTHCISLSGCSSSYGTESLTCEI